MYVCACVHTCVYDTSSCLCLLCVCVRVCIHVCMYTSSCLCLHLPPQENPETPEPELNHRSNSPFATDVEMKVKLPRNLKDIHRQLVEEIRLSNVTTTKTEATTQPSAQTKTRPTKTIPSVKPYPLPPALQGCDISNKKDAQSAISRATTDTCKSLIHNITCLGQARRLYDEEIKNACPLGKNPGQGFRPIPYSQGSGPLARVVFLLSVHGRAHRQMKRLFKAIYHTDHYYFVHVDSVSSLAWPRSFSSW